MVFLFSHSPCFSVSLPSLRSDRPTLCRCQLFPFLSGCKKESIPVVRKLSIINVVASQVSAKTNSSTLGSSASLKKSLQPTFILQGDTLQVSWFQRIVTTGTLCILVMLILQNIQDTIQILSSHELTSLLLTLFFALQLVAMDIGCLFMGYIAADFFSGLYHWFLDNYGNAKTPIIGKQCVAFQGHHEHPWTITYRPFCNLLGTSCLISCPFFLLLLVMPLPHFIQTILTSFGFFVVFAQQTHQWAHQTKPPSPWIETLQQMGVLLSIKAHGKHHKPPFNKNYCIVSGICNEILAIFSISMDS
ncbi:small conjugating protein ligase [Galdieria sulphuraria]|uniref:Small conjugating protein ligase n=1 Tax=Galdieria sulphuraria TaxID=130081 RepID=M2XKH9_GALSU|nr:small conjugating protein ligase [Galdieria sulphuraria]EME30642.1 small conjugating protein ligase [Galdieria sulphuraria]|eukprot:XP_005707162.1 small conjugating protein ligase [Galdieria sulphuraria]